jgi:hypothetical protein
MGRKTRSGPCIQAILDFEHVLDCFLSWLKRGPCCSCFHLGNYLWGSEIYKLKEAILPAIYILKSHETFNTGSGCLNRSACVVISSIYLLDFPVAATSTRKTFLVFGIWSRDLKLGGCGEDSKTPNNPTEKT